MSAEDKTPAGTALQELVDLIAGQGAMLAMLPIEEALETFRRADTLGPILDPTAYRNYLCKGHGEIAKGILEGALAFKQAILRAQAKARENPGSLIQ